MEDDRERQRCLTVMVREELCLDIEDGSYGEISRKGWRRCLCPTHDPGLRIRAGEVRLESKGWPREAARLVKVWDGRTVPPPRPPYTGRKNRPRSKLEDDFLVPSCRLQCRATPMEESREQDIYRMPPSSRKPPWSTVGRTPSFFPNLLVFQLTD